jgi:hypothetical protein
MLHAHVAGIERRRAPLWSRSAATVTAVATLLRPGTGGLGRLAIRHSVNAVPFGNAS